MSALTTASAIHRDPELLGQTVVVIGGSAGIGLETARRARAGGTHHDQHRPHGRNPRHRRRPAVRRCL